MEYVLGNRVRCSASFKDDAGLPVDPTTVSFKVKSPANVVTIYDLWTNMELVRDGVGLFHVDVDADLHGVWFYRFSSTGVGKAADEKSFTVQDSEFS